MSADHINIKFTLNSFTISRFSPRDSRFESLSSEDISLAAHLDEVIRSEELMASLFKQIQNSSLFQGEKAATMDLSFPFRYGFVKPIKIDENGDHELEDAHVQWNLDQISNDLQETHSVLKPLEYTVHNERLILAMHKKIVSLAKSLSDFLSLHIEQVSFHILSALHYLDVHQKINSAENYILINVDKDYVEFAAYLDSTLKDTKNIAITDTSVVQSVGLELRQALDYILSDQYNFKISKVFLFGKAIDKSYAKQISTALSTAIEIVTNFGDIDFKSPADKQDMQQAIYVSAML